MRKPAWHVLGAALFCYASAAALAAPPLKILYHETIRPRTQQVSGHTRSMSFVAYGRRFNLVLQPNEAITPAVPANRADIEPLQGELEGQAGSWVRLTHTRTGWHGIIADGQELYAVEPAANLAGALVQSPAPTSGSAPVMYRLKDALLPAGSPYCEILNADGSVYVDAAPTAGLTAKKLFDAIAADAASQVTPPDLQLTVGVVADYEFYQLFRDDPEGTIIARMDIVDGIWSNQVGVKIALAPLTVYESADQPFSKTAPTDLLAQVRSFRSSHAAQNNTGVTHLMTGRDLDGDIVGIAYMGTVCDSQTADSLSEGNHSTLMSGLIAAHEIGHNFNAPHDGEAGACASTPQNYLMAPKLNFSSQFSSCSLQQINTRIQSAQCLAPYQAPDMAVEVPATLVGALESSAFTISFIAHAIGDDPSKDVSALASLSANLTLQSASAEGGACTINNSSVTCSLGTLQPQETRHIDLTVVGTATGNGSATVSVASSNDTVNDNNSAQVSVQISATAPVTTGNSSTAGNSGASGGSGGGGRVDPMVLALLAGATVRAVRRRGARRMTTSGARC